jgi:hypothetical protein
VIKPKSCLGTADENLIINGGFDQNRCNKEWCAYNKNSFSPSDVVGWIPNPEI